MNWLTKIIKAGEKIKTAIHKRATKEDIDNKLKLNRLETPRVKVPRGSVGITEQFSNIYTFESPGGWNIIGNTPVKVFDKFKEKQPNLINPGDKVLFHQISKKEYLNWHDK